MSTDEERLIEFRNATNFRSVKRADPSISAILETSVYSVVYHYDERSERWEKQKMEGPLFVVRRDKTPEYQLYMLNRQTVKNPAIPLLPGEMKMTVIDDGMLQVARRGEKTRIGIWFSEGHEQVETFRAAILAIVGQPSKKTPAVASPQVAPNAPSQSFAQQPSQSTQEDGLSKLFAGLLPPINGNAAFSGGAPAPQSVSQGPTPREERPAPPLPSHRPSPVPAPPISSHPQYQPQPQAQYQVPPPTQIQASVSVTMPTAPPLPDSTAPAPTSENKLETADDLLASILGTVPLPPQSVPASVAQRVSPPAPASVQPHRQYTPQPSHPVPQAAASPANAFQRPQNYAGQHGYVSPQGQQPQIATEPYVRKSSKIGDATFAQAATAASFSGVSESSGIPGSPSNLPQYNQSQYNATHTGYPSQPFTHNNGQRTVSPLPPRPTQLSGYRPNAEGKAVMAEAVTDVIVKKEQEENVRIWGVELSAEQRKLEFKRRLVDLMMTDEEFVDGLWNSYLERMAGMRTAPKATNGWFER
ncbi:hypothetical protein I350_03489 [Cryptococcus amylolentus CBS 6273]|uniref:mRNA-decapping enzyme C-terminal domain-containing protein n=1 Tax=Cryptococcus amylolentus CBS 6273 TaxID=1296118 RepID=A0A1E3K3U7_9TREE|nr:hypothetical protein I350_03489 [Cryptococcus amylolentus CBS 6273]